MQTVSKLTGQDITPPLVDYMANAIEIQALIEKENWTQAIQLASVFGSHDKDHVRDQAALLSDTL